jgi:hypothetical protein
MSPREAGVAQPLCRFMSGGFRRFRGMSHVNKVREVGILGLDCEAVAAFGRPR